MRGDPNNEMCQLLRETFRKSGMSVKQLSDRSGVLYSSAHAIVNGQRDPALSTVVKLCRVLGLELRPVRRGRRKG